MPRQTHKTRQRYSLSNKLESIFHFDIAKPCQKIVDTGASCCLFSLPSIPTPSLTSSFSSSPPPCSTEFHLTPCMSCLYCIFVSCLCVLSVCVVLMPLSLCVLSAVVSVPLLVLLLCVLCVLFRAGLVCILFLSAVLSAVLSVVLSVVLSTVLSCSCFAFGQCLCSLLFC